MLFVVFTAFLLVSSAAVAGDFDWIRDFNIKAEADPSGFRARLAARFKIGNVEVNTVISSVEKPADAYMVFSLGEMSKQPTDYVIEKYKSGKGQRLGCTCEESGDKTWFKGVS